MLARPVILGSVRLTVPVLPSTWSSAPCQVSRPASVTTKDGMPKRVKRAPWSAPIATPATMAAAIAVYGLHPCWTFSTAITAAARPLTAPTDRSISPSRRTKTTPTEIRPTAVIWRKRLVRFSAVRKWLFSSWNTSQISPSTMKTRSEARSPSTKRRTTFSRGAFRPAGHRRRGRRSLPSSSPITSGRGADAVAGPGDRRDDLLGPGLRSDEARLPPAEPQDEDPVGHLEDVVPGCG